MINDFAMLYEWIFDRLTFESSKRESIREE